MLENYLKIDYRPNFWSQVEGAYTIYTLLRDFHETLQVFFLTKVNFGFFLRKICTRPLSSSSHTQLTCEIETCEHFTKRGTAKKYIFAASSERH
jgi:hypothetical protein